METKQKEKSLVEEFGISDERAKEMFVEVINEMAKHENISDILKSFIVSHASTTEIIIMSYMVGTFNENPEKFQKLYAIAMMESLMSEIKKKNNL